MAGRRGATKFGVSYDLYMASIQQPLPYPEHEFINLAWAAESLHRGLQREAGESLTPRTTEDKN